ncbi:MAG: hypothetical protein NTZ46_03905 [Verrucomicrobia bacterium]|nr:hypothetical protein [Verrucomicrobiota bacterium]
MEKAIKRAAGIAACTGATLLAACQCTPPVGEYVKTEVDLSCPKTRVVACPTRAVSSTTVTVIHRTGEACAPLPPVGEITVVRNAPARIKMVFVYVRPADDRCYNIDSRNFERPWPWGPYGTGNW